VPEKRPASAPRKPAFARRSVVTAFVAVGSNLDPETHILAALRALQARVQVRAVSAFYQTPALPAPAGSIGPQPAPFFLNGVFRIETALEPRAVKFAVLRPIEAGLGRVRTADRYAPRTLDLDLILHGRTVALERDLRLPDPGIRTRNFIAVPLLELAPDLVLPDTGERLQTLPVAKDRGGLALRTDFTRQLRAVLKA